MAQEYESLTVEEHIRTKDMWAGAIDRIEIPMIIFSRRSSVISAKYQVIKQVRRYTNVSMNH